MLNMRDLHGKNREENTGKLHNYFPHHPNLVSPELIKPSGKQPVRAEVGYAHLGAQSQNSE